MKKMILVLLLCVLMLSTFSAGFPRALIAGSDSLSPVQDSVSASAVDWWPMFHHDLSHTGTSTSTGPNTNTTLWTSPIGGVVFSSPAVVGGFVYVGCGSVNLAGIVYCLNAATGAVVWNYTTGGGVYSCPAVVGGLVYVGSWDGKVHCLNAATGAVVWSYKTGGTVKYSSPAVVGGLVYVGSYDDSVYCLNAATGALVWSYKTGGSVGDSSPAVVGGLVYVGSADWKIYCLNAATGALVWSYKTGVWVESSPAVAGGLVYVGSWDDSVYCLNAATGALVWSYKTGSPVSSSPAVAGGLVYVGSWDEKVHCLNAVTGALVWSYKTGGLVEYSSPAVAGGLVYVGSWDEKVHCLNAVTGALVWSYKTGSPVDSSPAVVDGVVYVGSTDYTIYAFGSSAPARHLHMESMQDTGATSNLGTIAFNGTSYSLPNDVSKPAGSYQAKYTAASSTYSFDHWETSGGISVSSKYGNPTTVTVSGDGTLRAFYKTTVFSDGFESGNFSAWTGTSVSAGETATVVNTLKHHGTYSARFTSNGTGGTEYAYCSKTISSSSELYARAYFYASQSGIVDENDRFYFIVLSGSSDVAYAGWRKTGGVTKWTLVIRNGTSSVFAYSSGSPSLNQWYCVELHWKKSSTAGLGELFINGARVCSIMGKNTTAYGSVTKARFGLPAIYYCGSTRAYCDCVKVARTYVGPEYVFSDGFESGSFSAWTGKSVSAGETATVTSSIAHHGNHSAKLTSNGNGGFEYASCYKSVSSLSEVYARGYFRVAASGMVEDGDRISFMAFANASGYNAAYAGWCKTGGVVKWFLVVNSIVLYSTASPSLNTWYCVELHWKKSSTAGLGELYVNGVKVCSIIAGNTASYGSVSQAIFGLALLNCASATAYCDCTKIATNYIGLEY